MYVSSVKIHNIRCFKKLEINLPAARPDGNWIVLLGENGVGKSTILRAIALALAPERAANQLLAQPEEWLHDPDADGQCEISLGFSARENQTSDDRRKLSFRISKGRFPSGMPGDAVLQFLESVSDMDWPNMETPWTSLVVGYGAYRRPVSLERPETGSNHWFRTLFTDEAGVPDLEAWLKDLDYRSKSTNSKRRDHFERMLRVVNEVVRGLMPEGQRYEMSVSPDGVFFRRASGERVPLSGMSDGYRAMFALAADLVRRWLRGADHRPDALLDYRYDGDQLVIDIPGIVLIDEVDAHLHPKWQREIGFYLQRIFPKVQFIVATHSPFVAQAASPDGIIILRQKGQVVEVDDTLSSLRGISAGDILQSKAFDLEMLRDLETQALLKEHDDLSHQLSAGKLSEAKRKRLAEVEQVLFERQAPEQPKSDILADLERVIREVKQRHD